MRARPAAAIAILAIDAPMTESNNVDCNTSDTPSPKKCARIEINEEPESIAQQMYWPDSPEARQVFKPTTSRSASRIRRSAASGVGIGNSSAGLDDETAKETLERMVNTSEDGWRNVVIMGRDINSHQLLYKGQHF